MSQNSPVARSTPPFQSALRAPQPPRAAYSTNKNYLGLPQLEIPHSAGPKAVLNRQSSYPNSPTSPALSSALTQGSKFNFREEPGMMREGEGDPIWKRFSKEKEVSEDEKA